MKDGPGGQIIIGDWQWDRSWQDVRVELDPFLELFEDRAGLLPLDTALTGVAQPTSGA